MQSSVNVFNYTNHREFLQAFYDVNKKEKKQFSYRWFNSRVGLASPSHLKDIITGRSNVGHKTLTKLVKGLGLKKKESEFFEHVVYFNQAKTLEEKNEYLEKIRLLRSPNPARIVNEFEQSLFGHWVWVALREMVLLDDFKEDPDQISKRFYEKVSSKQIETAISKLIKLGFLKRKNGKLVQSERHIVSSDEVRSLIMQSFHKQMLERAIQAIDLPVSQRELAGLTIALSQDEFEDLKEKIKEFRKTTISKLKKPRKVYQLNIQLFPLVKSTEEI